MRREGRSRITRKLLTCGLFCAALVLFVGGARADGPSVAPAAGAEAWAASPFRSFGLSENLTENVSLSDESDDPALRAALASELRRLRVELHEKQGWADPLAAGDSLKVLLARREAQGVRRVAARSIDRHHLVDATIQVDASGMTSGQIVHEVAKLYALATLEAYGAPDSTFLSGAVAEALVTDGRSDAALESLRIAAAAPSLDFVSRPDSLGRMYVDEFARATGGYSAVRALWERAAQSGEGVMPLFQRAWAEATGERDDGLLLRAAARTYTIVETETSPSRIALADLEAGGLDAATPATFSVRHRSFLAPADSSGALRISWPDRSAPGAAVVRYRDTALAPDVIVWKPGSTHTVPLSGVARVDWVVGGLSSSGPPLDEQRATVQTLAAFPFGNVSAQAAAGPGSPYVAWTTSGHEGLAGWVVFREEVLPDGRIARTGPQMLPSTAQASESFRYAYVDPDAAAGTFYRYNVWAVTEDGLLAKAFSATLRTAD